MNEADRKALARDMYAAVRDLMGSGYVPDYYMQLASDFVMVAEGYVDDAVKEALKADRLKRRRRRANVQFRFVGRVGGQLVWESRESTTGDSRHEQMSITADAFWHPERYRRRPSGGDGAERP